MSEPHGPQRTALRRGEVLRDAELHSPDGQVRLVCGPGWISVHREGKPVYVRLMELPDGAGLHLDAAGLLQIRGYDGALLWSLPPTELPAGAEPHAVVVRDNGNADLVDEHGTTLWSSQTADTLQPDVPRAPETFIRFCRSGPVPAGGRPAVAWGELDYAESRVFRTDFSDDHAWAQLVEELREPWGGGDFVPSHVVVDDPAYAGATVEELRALQPPDMVPVMFLADAASMRGEHLLLAVNLHDEDERDYADFRLTPRSVAQVHSSLEIAVVDFDEFAWNAEQQPDGVHRDD